MSRILHPQVLTIWITLISRATADLTCDALLLLSTNLTARTLILWNQTSSPTNSTGLFCNTSIDGIGTCWPRSSAGEVVSRPCPETFLGVRYNTTNNVYRECLALMLVQLMLVQPGELIDALHINLLRESQAEHRALSPEKYRSVGFRNSKNGRRIWWLRKKIGTHPSTFLPSAKAGLAPRETPVKAPSSKRAF
ncbi:uncharacterized protein LOC109057154 [Cyprinus carpio]|uniref:Uncharacterized protein LOC109057154 n=1 Tax=Cyprinus carpio TaxID=7962 RepID=A0A9Q9ZXI0_CYPCA|nr:uncharacterized protein LOC109057154 [Cyprinus carpio]